MNQKILYLVVSTSIIVLISFMSSWAEKEVNIGCLQSSISLGGCVKDSRNLLSRIMKRIDGYSIYCTREQEKKSRRY